jgi:hypothetical protein
LFDDIFQLKSELGGFQPSEFRNTVPSDGVISRVTVQQYPRGGGGQAEHVDPTSPFARIQTLVQASQRGVDYHEGGLYVRPGDTGECIDVDQYTEMGDLVIASPAIRHGVAAVDPGKDLNWGSADGRWTIIPIIIRSDYNMDPDTKPRPS